MPVAAAPVSPGRSRRPRTAPDREPGEAVPSFFPRQARQRPLAEQTSASEDLQSVQARRRTLSPSAPSGRRFSSNTLLDQSAQIGAKLFHQRRPSASAAVPVPTRVITSTEQRFGQWNSWLPNTHVSAEGIKHFVADRKASVSSIVRKVRASSSHQLQESAHSPMHEDTAQAAADDMEYICDNTDDDMLEGFDPVRPITTEKPVNRRSPLIKSKAASSPLLRAPPEDEEVDSKEPEPAEDPDPTSDADSYAFYTPRGSIANNTPWIGELSAAPSTIFETAEVARRPARPRSSASTYRKTLHRDSPDSGRRSSRTMDDGRRVPRSPPIARSKPAFSSTKTMTVVTTFEAADAPERPGPSQTTPTPVIVTSTSDAHLIPVKIPDETSPEASEQQAAQPCPAQAESGRHPPPATTRALRPEPKVRMDKVRALQLRIAQLEKELQVAQQNAELWKFEYTALSITHEAQSRAFEKLQASIKGSVPQKKSRRLSAGQLPKLVTKSSSPALPATETMQSRAMAKSPVVDGPDSRSPDNATFADADEDPVPASTRAKRQRSQQSTRVPPHRTLSISEHLDYIASAPNEGIDAATLNSLMPEERNARRRRGMSTSAASGVSNVAGGIKAKLRTSPSAGSVPPTPALPVKSPRRPNMKLFGRRPSNLPSSAASINSGTTSPLPIHTPLPGEDESPFGGQPPPMTHSRRSSRVLDIAALLPQWHSSSSSSDPSAEPSTGRHRSGSVVGKLSRTTLSTAGRLVTAGLNKGNALLHSNSTASDTAPAAAPEAQQKLVSVTSKQVVQSPPLATEPGLQAAAEISPGSMPANEGPESGPEWLNKIAFEASDSEEEQPQQEAAGGQETPVQPPPVPKDTPTQEVDGLSSALASSIALNRFTDVSRQASLSVNAAAQGRTGEPPAPAAAEARADLEQLAVGATGEEGAVAKAVRSTKSASTLSSGATCHNSATGPAADQAREGIVNDDVERRSVRSVASSNAVRPPSVPEKAAMPSTRPRSSFSSRRDTVETPDSAKYSDARSFQRALHLQPESGQNPALVSTRSSTRSQSSLRNRPPLPTTALSGAASPISRSSSKMGSHDVRVSLPHSPAPPSPSPSPSPPLGSSGGAASPDIVEQGSDQAATPSTEEHTLLESKAPAPTPGRSNPLKKLYKQALLTKKSTHAMKIPSPELPSLTPSGPSFQPSDAQQGLTMVDLKDSLGSIIRIDKATPAVPQHEDDVEAAAKTSIQSDRALHEAHYPQSLAMQFDWLQASIAFADDTIPASASAPAAASAVPPPPPPPPATRQSKSSDRALSLVDVEGLDASLLAMEGIGLGIDNVFADPVGAQGAQKRGAAAQPAPGSAPTQKYAHITPPSSDAE